MEFIESQLFYHIQINSAWNIEETYFIGKGKNPFCNFFDVTHVNYNSPKTGTILGINWIGDNMCYVINGGVINSEVTAHFSFDARESVLHLNRGLGHYLKFVREHLYEEVRKDFFPNLPSRQRCLWVIPNDKEAVRYWWKSLGSKGRILEVELTGKIHKVSEQYLVLSTNSFNWIREQAFKYWASISGSDPVENECLFEGFVKIVAVKEISDFN